MEKGSGNEKTLTLNKKEYQTEEQEVELLEDTEEVIESEEHPEISFEIIVGAEGTSPPKPTEKDGDHDDQTVSSNEKEEEPLSEKGVLTKETFTLTPKAIRESVKQINFELNLPEREENAPRVETTGEVRKKAATTSQKPEETKAAEPDEGATDLNYTFGKQESVSELYTKVLKAVASYQQEKAAHEQYQIYKARTAALSEGKDDAERQSLSPTIEAEKEVDELINRAERIASERARILKRIKVDALNVYETIEEARWRVYELFREQTVTNEAGQASGQVTKTNKSRPRTESGGSYQEKECSEASGEKLESRTEKKEVLQEEALRQYWKEREGSIGKTAEKRVLEVNEQSNEEFLENINKTKTGEEENGEPHTREKSVQSEISDRPKKSEREPTNEQGAAAVEPEEGSANYRKEGFEPLGEYQKSTEVVQTEEIQRKLSKKGTLKPTAILDEETPPLEGSGNRTTIWVTQHQSQSVDESIEELRALRLSASSGETDRQVGTERREELNPLEVGSTPPRKRLPGRASGTPEGSSGYLGTNWGRNGTAMARMPNFKMPLFHGKEGENYERFFDEMAGLMRISGWSPDEYLEIVKIGLKDGAATWLKAVPRDDQDSLEKVKAIIKEAFGDKRPRWQRHRDLHNLRQEKGQSVRDFALKIKEYAFPDDVDDGQLLSVFVAGLPRHIGMELAKSELSSLDKAVAQAVRIESVDKRGPDRKPEVMVLEMDRNLGARKEPNVEINMSEFDGMMENQFMDYQPQSQSNQGGYNRGQSNYRGRSRYQNQGNFNNRIQGSQQGRQLNESEYKQRSMTRAAEYKRMMKLQTGGANPTPIGSAEGGAQHRYCIIHDSRSHTTAECDLLKEIYQNKEEQVTQARPKQVTFVPTNQGN